MSRDHKYFVRVARYVPALLLIGVFTVQRSQVAFVDQVYGRGGGFGMFSTVDTASMRALRVHVLTAEGREIPVLAARDNRTLPDLFAEKLLIRPTEQALREAGERLLQRDWYAYGPGDWAELVPLLPVEVRRHAKRLEAAEGDGLHVAGADVALPWASVGEHLEGRLLDVQGVRVEVWANRLDSLQVKGRLVTQQTVRRTS